MRKHLSIPVLMLTATAAAWAQPARGLAWAWVSSATAPSAYQFNSAGGTITVTNGSTGNYIVNIPNLGTTGGIAHVVAYGGSHYCNIWAWAPSGTTQQVGVNCRNSAGALANGDFSVLFYKENRAVTQWDDGYLWADQAASASYTPSATYQWNSKGGSNTVVRTSVGRYTATFPGLGPLGHLGSVLVTSYGNTNTARCRVQGWGGSPNVIVNVACDTPAGVAVDSLYTLSFFSDMAFGVNQGQEQRRGAFVWSDQSESANYIPSLFYQYNSAGSPLRARRSGTGQYQIDIPGLIPANSSNVQVVRYGNAGYCNVGRWGGGPNNGTTVFVNCFTTAGAPQDAHFALTYLTSQLATAELPSPGGPTRAKAWVWSDSLAGSPSPNPLYQFNSAGGTNSVTRLFGGAYRVDLPGLGTGGGFVHVNAYGANNYCKAHSWGPNGTTQEIYVMCFSPSGGIANSLFTVLFYKENRTGSNFNAGYARSFIPIASAAVQPPSAYSWNGRLQANQVTRTATGRYNVAFSGLIQSPNGGNVLVTPYGTVPTRCKVSSWSGETATVVCSLIDGTLVDSEFGVSYVVDTAFGSDTLANGHPGGYAWANDSSSASYQPSSSFRFNSAGGDFLATRSSAGPYTMEFGLLKPFNKTVPIITAYGEGAGEAGAYCRPDGWFSKSGGPGTGIIVGCLNAAGNRVDSRYTVLYLTNPLVPSAVQVAAGSPQSAPVGTQFATTLQARVVEGDIPVPGVTVNFAAPGSGASALLSAPSAVTNASGIASVTATANGAAGSYNVTATVAGLTAATFALTNTPAGSAGPPPPTIVTPANGSTLTASAVTFSWTPAPGTGKSYDFRLFNQAGDKLELRLSFIGDLTSQVYTLKSGSYRIEMRTCNPACGPPAISTFTVALGTIPSTAPTGVACGVVNDNNQNRLNCAWNAFAGADFYFVNLIQPNTGPGGGALTVAGTQIGPNNISLLVPNGFANFIVRACNGDGCGPFNSPVGVSPGFGNPLVPIVAEPFNGFVVDAGAAVPGPTFTWNRIAGDNGANYSYRLYVQDFSRNAATVDVVTDNNFHAAYLNPFTRYDVLVVAIPKAGGTSSQGPANGFVAKGAVPNAPSFVSPTVFSTVGAGPVILGWTPVPDSNGNTGNRLYHVVLTGPTPQNFSTTDLTKIANLGAGAYSGKVRSCNTVGAAACDPANDIGWGPFSGSAGAQGGSGFFTVQ